MSAPLNFCLFISLSGSLFVCFPICHCFASMDRLSLFLSHKCSYKDVYVLILRKPLHTFTRNGPTNSEIRLERGRPPPKKGGDLGFCVRCVARYRKNAQNLLNKLIFVSLLLLSPRSSSFTPFPSYSHPLILIRFFDPNMDQELWLKGPIHTFIKTCNIKLKYCELC